MLAAAPGIGLTISLGGATDAARRAVMPVPGRTPVAEVVDLAARYARRCHRRVTVAWVLIAGRTDTPAESHALASLLRGKPLKVNLIPLNPVDDALEPPSTGTVLEFQRVLQEAGVAAYIRSSGGRDIDAACGQLRRRRQPGA